MSVIGHTQLLAARQSQISGALLGSLSLFSPQGWQSVTPFNVDDTGSLQTADGAAPNFGSQVRFSLHKNATLIGKPVFKITVGAATLGGGRSAAYVDSLGDQLITTVTLRYGSSILQTIPHRIFAPMYRRLTKNDVNLEADYAMILGGLPVAGASEAVRQNAVTAGLDLFVPLDYLYWANQKSKYWFPEAYALECEVILQLNVLSQLVYSDNGLDPFTADPVLSAPELRFQEITLSAAEKQNRLKTYASAQGNVQHFLDIEQQLNFSLGAGGASGLARDVRVPLDNLRLDISELIFMVRIQSDGAGGVAPAVGSDWRGDALESSTAASIITGATVACVLPVNSFRLEANGKRLFQDQTEFWNRTQVRKVYHPLSQISAPYYFISFAMYPEDENNVSGFISASVLGKVELVINMQDWAANQTVRCDVMARSHNLLQSRAGSVTKALN